MRALIEQTEFKARNTPRGIMPVVAMVGVQKAIEHNNRVLEDDLAVVLYQSDIRDAGKIRHIWLKPFTLSEKSDIINNRYA